jgi:hypothetical protein
VLVLVLMLVLTWVLVLVLVLVTVLTTVVVVAPPELSAMYAPAATTTTISTTTRPMVVPLVPVLLRFIFNTAAGAGDLLVVDCLYSGNHIV